MAPSSPERLRAVRKFEDLVKYLQDELDWPLGDHPFEDLTFEYSAQELGLKDETIADGTRIRQLRPLKTGQPWGIFFVEFPKKRLPVLVLRRILQSLIIKKRASSQRSKTATWDAKDLLFISAFGDEAGGEREIAFGHFHEENGDKPVLRVLDWDGSDTPLKLARLDDTLKRKLAWIQDGETIDHWRDRWSSAFRLRLNHVIRTSDRMADVLAGFARGIRQKVLAGLAAESEKGPLHVLLEEFRKSLLHDLTGADFADTYAQTVTYGLLSLAITKTQAGQPKAVTAGHLVSEVPLTSPFLKDILGELLKRGGRKGGLDYDELGLHEVVEFLNADETDLPAILADFGNKTAADDPVIHFYEHFLSAYDKKLKIQRGVFYTPRPVVSYIVRSVHEILQTEFGLIDGLADTATWGWMAERHPGLAIPDGIEKTDRFVTILDPATGTATFLVEVIDVIYRTLVKKWQGEGHGKEKRTELWNSYVPEHLLPRLYGYELLMAPYAIAHLKIGLKLAETGYAFEAPATANVFLTNALVPAEERKLTGLGLMALAHEAEAVTAVKRKKRFTVVIGNPPYSSLSQNMGDWIKALVRPFRSIEGAPIEEKGKRNHLQDDYVKFFRLALLQLEESGAGVLGLITNHGYLYSPTFRAMRHYILNRISGGRVVDLNGNAKRDDATRFPGDENVFDIQQGVAISIAWMTPRNGPAVLAHGALFGSRAEKTRILSTAPESIRFQAIHPSPDYYLFESSDVQRFPEYQEWEKLDEAMPFGGTGVKTNRDDFVIDFEDAPLLRRMEIFRDPSVSDAEAQKRLELGENYTWKIPKQRRLFRDDHDHDRLRDIEYRPFDRRRIYYQRHVVYNPRFETMAQASEAGVFLLLCRQQFETGFRHAFVTRRMFECCLVSAKSREITSGFPLYVSGREGRSALFQSSQRANFSSAFRDRLKATAGLEIADDAPSAGRPDHIPPAAVLGYCYAILHSPTYRERYAESLKLDFPRIPLLKNRELFSSLERLGNDLIALHLLESPRLEMHISTYMGHPNPEVGRVGWSAETVWLDLPTPKKGQSPELGTTGFRDVPKEVWSFEIGGYQVCEKWLKDRKGRTLSPDDIAHYQRIVVAIAETIRLMKEIDKVIEAHGGWPRAFQIAGAKAAADGILPFRRVDEPKAEERWVTCLPLVPFEVAAGVFGDPQNIDESDFEWVAVNARHALRRGMFVAQVVGKSMEPAIPDGAFCLFAAPVEGTRQGKTVLVQLRDKKDSETGERYTVKRYESEKVPDEESWRHARITLKPVNRDFAAIDLAGGEGDLTVIAEFIEVLGKPGPTERG